MYELRKRQNKILGKLQKEILDLHEENKEYKNTKECEVWVNI